MNRVIGYVMNADMRLSHDGLRALAAEQRPRMDVDKLKPGEFVLFTNVAFTACKIFGGGNTFIYHKGAHPMNPRALAKAVECFDGFKLDYPTALRAAIEQALSPELKDWLKKHRTESVKLKLNRQGVVKVTIDRADRRRRA